MSLSRGATLPLRPRPLRRGRAVNSSHNQEAALQPISGSTDKETNSEPSGPAFARHETFAPRFGWLRKSYVASVSDARAFSAPDVHVRLGVGKNMARAIRYWGHAFKLLEEGQLGGRRDLASTP